MNTQRAILHSSLVACAQRVDKLRQSLQRTQELLPLPMELAARMTDAQEESFDALILRYSQCASMLQDQVFRGIAYLEQEDIGDKSNRDKALLMEKLGAIKSAETFGTAALLRNKLTHHYPDQSKLQLEQINLVVAESHVIVEVFESVRRYLERKGLTS
jgi:hypothetical protein